MKTTVGVIFFGIFSGVAAQTQFIANIPYQQSPVVNPGGRVPFSNTIQNVNSAYDPVNHNFTCPDAGFYTLSFMITLTGNAPNSTFGLMSSYSGTNAMMKIVLPHLNNAYSSNSGTIMYYCNTGESLWVEMCPDYGQTSVVLAWDLNSFSGALLLSPSESPSFIATGSGDSSVTIAVGETVPYTTVVQNNAASYVTQNYWFICPDQGIYMYSFTTARVDQDAGSAEFHLMSSLNGILMKVQQPQLAYPYGSTSGTIMYSCQSGEKLWVELCPNCNGFPYSLSLEHNTFSGGLIIDSETTDPVSFYATVSSSTNVQFNPGEYIKFNSVVQNYGLAYDGDCTFTCPVPGSYMFSIRFTRYDSASSRAEFHLLSSSNPAILLKVIVPEVNEQYSSNSGTVMYQCSGGERISVQLCANCGNNVATLYGDRNMFSAALLYEG